MVFSSFWHTLVILILIIIYPSRKTISYKHIFRVSVQKLTEI